MTDAKTPFLAALLLIAPTAMAEPDDALDPLQLPDDGMVVSSLVPTPSGAVLQWNVLAASEQVKAMVVYRQLEDEGYKKLEKLDPDNLTFEDVTADPNATYSYVVAAILHPHTPVRGPEMPRPPVCKPVSILLLPPPPGVSVDPDCVTENSHFPSL